VGGRVLTTVAEISNHLARARAPQQATLLNLKIGVNACHIAAVIELTVRKLKAHCPAHSTTH
jgi:hypothetical protein